MIKKYFVLAIIFFIGIGFFHHDLSFANEFEKLDLPKASLNPGDFYYPAKRLIEKIMEKLQFNNAARFRYYNSILDQRMSELGYVVQNKRLGELERATQRLAFYSGTLTQYLTSHGSGKEKEEVSDKFKNFMNALNELRDKYPANSSFWMLVQHDINSLRESSEKLK